MQESFSVRCMSPGFELKIKPKVIFAGLRSVAKEGKRYKIYLPIPLNDVWRKLHSRKVRLEVYLVPVDIND